MLDSPRHRRILALLMLAFCLSSYFWVDHLLAWTRLYGSDIQTLGALIGVLLGIVGVVAAILQLRGGAIGAWAADQAQIAERQARDLLLGRVGDEVRQRLDTSLYHQVQIVLERRLDRTAVALHRTLERRGQPPEPVPRGTRTSDLFDQVGGALLILGEPGAGKTVELLNLAAALLEQARQEPDRHQPVPVIFNLSGWATERLPLAAWMAAELARQFGGGRKTWAARIEQGRILPLLDGLDEVAADHRTACARAIDAFRDAHDLCRLAVCCRRLEYEDLPNLKLQAAVVIQPLDRGQIEHYLIDAGQSLAGLRQAIARDPELAALAASPLMLNVMSLTYEDQSCEAILAPTAVADPAGAPDLAGRRDGLFAAYLDRAFERKRGTAARWSEARTRRYLIRLAYEMKKRELTPFLIEELQPDWSGRWGMLPVWLLVVPAVAVSPVLIGWALRGIFVGDQTFPRAIYDSPVYLGLGPLTFGFLAALLSYPLIAWENIRRAETLHWSFQELARLANSESAATIGALLGLALGPALGVIFGSWLYDFDLITGGLIGAGLGLMLAPAILGIEYRINTHTSQPNAGIAASMRNGLRLSAIAIPPVLVGSIPIIFSGPAARLPGANKSLLFTLTMVSAIALPIGFWLLGGGAAIRHYILRLGLAIERRFPIDLTAFLDHAAHLIILQRVGGGWRFIHGLLWDHLAAQDQRSTRSLRRGRAGS